jgi:hypothetical protein
VRGRAREDGRRIGSHANSGEMPERDAKKMRASVEITYQRVHADLPVSF